MMSEEEFWESDVLRNLRLASEARGWEFHVNPPREIVPDFLGNFRPDAIALGPEGGIVIEVKHRRSQASEKQLAEIAKTVSHQKGWEFRAIYLDPSADRAPAIAKPTSQQLQAAFEEVETLAKGGHNAAALVAAWAAFESLARFATASRETGAARVFSPIQAVQTLAEEGYIENDAADRLRDTTKLRNAVVHGDLSVDVSPEQVEYLLNNLRVIASNVEAAT